MRLFFLGVVFYLLSAGITFGVLSATATPTLQNEVPIIDEAEETKLSALLNIDPAEPKDQECPLNGELFTLTEKNAWEKRRPLAVMIENHEEARPQSGLSRADVVYEIMAEGAITRFMGLFYCDAQREDVLLAPVRSARTYFVDYASGYNFPMYVHVGGANIPGPSDALGQIANYGWALQNDINLGFTFGLPYYKRVDNRTGKSVALEHQGQTSTELLWELAEEKRNWTNIAPERKINGKLVPASDWKDGFTLLTFLDELPTSGSVTKIAHEFWSGYKSWAVEWNYDSGTNSYSRTMGGEPHVDNNNQEQIKASNVIIILTDEKGPINEAKHMLYTTIGTGKALIFNNGQVTEAKWSKPKREAELRFVDSKGKDIPLVRGSQWIAVIDKDTPIEY